MRRMRLLVTLASLASLACIAPSAHAENRYSFANGCWTLQSSSAPVTGGPFFVKPTDLGSYMLYDKDKHFLSADSNGEITNADDGGPNGDWRVTDGPGGAFKVELPAQGKALGVTDGKLALVEPGAAGLFNLSKATGC